MPGMQQQHIPGAQGAGMMPGMPGMHQFPPMMSGMGSAWTTAMPTETLSHTETMDRTETVVVGFDDRLASLQRKKQQGRLTASAFYSRLKELIREFPDKAAEPEIQAILNKAKGDVGTSSRATTASSAVTPTVNASDLVARMKSMSASSKVMDTETRKQESKLRHLKEENSSSKGTLTRRMGGGLAEDLKTTARQYLRQAKGLDVVLVMDTTGMSKDTPDLDRLKLHYFDVF